MIFMNSFLIKPSFTFSLCRTWVCYTVLKHNTSAGSDRLEFSLEVLSNKHFNTVIASLNRVGFIRGLQCQGQRDALNRPPDVPVTGQMSAQVCKSVMEGTRPLAEVPHPLMGWGCRASLKWVSRLNRALWDTKQEGRRGWKRNGKRVKLPIYKKPSKKP